MRYPFVLFDVGETLIGPRRSYGAVYAEVLSGFGLSLSEERLSGGMRRAGDELGRLIPPGTDRFSHFPGGEAEFWLRFASRTIALATEGRSGAEVAEKALEPLRAAFKKPGAWVVYPDVVPTLESLRGAGCTLAVVSNWDSRLPDLLETLGLAGYFEVIGVSGLERVEKPDPAFFRRVLTRLDASPERALHVGNVPHLDLDGARAAGIDGLLVDRRGDLPAVHRASPDFYCLPALVR